MYRAVIADDEPFMLEGMRLMIDWQRCGFALCGEARTARDALHLVDTLQPHLLITDVRMPGMLGTDLAAIVACYYPETMILFFSGYRDFSYAQSAIHSHAFGYLLKPIDVEEVENTLKRAKTELDARQAAMQRESKLPPVLRDQVFNRIACGDDNPESLLRAGVLLKLQPEDPCYCAVLANRQGAVSDNARLVLASANAVIFELSPREYGLVFRQIERDLMALERLTKLLSDREDNTLSVGCVHSGAHGFQKSLSEALDAQGVLYEASGALRLYRPFDAQATAWLDHACLSAIRDSLIAGKADMLEAVVKDLRKAAQKAKPSLFALRCMAATLDSMLPAEASDSGALPGRPLWQQNAADCDAWLDAFIDQLHAIQHSMLSNVRQAYPSAVLTAVEAIRTRYAEPLNLNKIAGDLHMNPAYLGQLVKKHTGSTFNRLLLMARIEHACPLLRQTASPVGEIAISVGFHDVDYFSQRFRNRMGMSPVAYRYAVAPKEDAHAPNQ
ncbi:MAG: response regulator [Clostridiales bacterium]|nr:response regulator [Clostridiales bacterium]